jgi:hypothetical protein
MTVLAQGRMYCTPKRLLFSSVFTSTFIDIEWSRVERLERAVTFPLIPNGIDIILKDGTVFNSFANKFDRSSDSSRSCIATLHSPFYFNYGLRELLKASPTLLLFHLPHHCQNQKSHRPFSARRYPLPLKR